MFLFIPAWRGHSVSLNFQLPSIKNITAVNVNHCSAKHKTGQAEWQSWALFFWCFVVVVVGLVGWLVFCCCLGFLFVFVWCFCLLGFEFWGFFVCKEEKNENEMGANCKAFSFHFKLV